MTSPLRTYDVRVDLRDPPLPGVARTLTVSVKATSRAEAHARAKKIALRIAAGQDSRGITQRMRRASHGE